jgi:hypothetical protein
MYLLSSYILLLLCLHIYGENTSSPNYRHLAAKYCYIEDYSNWLEQQKSLEYFLQFARFFDLDTQRIEAELERYRLQRECLRAVERLPILVGGG